MRKLWMAGLLAALAVAVLPVRAPAKHTLDHKVRALQGKVTALQKRVRCLRRSGAATYVGYAWYEGSLDPGGGPYDVHGAAARVE